MLEPTSQNRAEMHFFEFTYLIIILFEFRKMPTFNYTNEGQERPTESTFSDMQSLNKFTDEVSCAHFIFNLYNVFLVSSAKGLYARFGGVVSTAGK